MLLVIPHGPRALVKSPHAEHDSKEEETEHERRSGIAYLVDPVSQVKKEKRGENDCKSPRAQDEDIRVFRRFLSCQ